MITKDQNKACLLVAEEACANPAWRDYGEYCRNRERGLRKQAFAHLNAFLDAAQSWSYEDKRIFVEWLCGKMDTVGEADYGPYPTPLAKRLFQPLFQEWIQKEPDNAEALALKAQYAPDFESYRKAVQIDPENQRARLALARECVYEISHSTHHLPDYFIGNEDAILALVPEAEEHIRHLDDGIRKQDVTDDLRSEEQLLRDWIEFKTEGGDDFDRWCKNKGRGYQWIKAYYYDE